MCPGCVVFFKSTFRCFEVFSIRAEGQRYVGSCCYSIASVEMHPEIKWMFENQVRSKIGY